MALKYMSGEEIRKGHRVLLDGQAGEIEFVADPLAPNPDTLWYIEEFGGGVMISEPNFLGSVFTSGDDDDLTFVSRAKS